MDIHRTRSGKYRRMSRSYHMQKWHGRTILPDNFSPCIARCWHNLQPKACAIFRIMNRLLKTLLIWILMAVLPLSAAAASIGMACGPGHQPVMQVAMSHDATHVMQDDANHHHDGDHSGGLAAASMPAHADPGGADQADHATHSTCSACSAFCMGAVAPPSVSVSIPSFSGSEDLMVSAAPRVSGFIPEGLRRPPRQSFA